MICSVRPFVPGDSQRVAQLAAQLGYPSDTAEIAHRVRDMQNGSEYAVYVAETGTGHIVGWVGISLFRCVELDGFAEIRGLVVDEHRRSRGVGALLLNAAEHWARSRGFNVLCVSSNAVRERAHHFYQRHGYEQIKVQKVFRKTLG